jgi:hypothetical protein
MWVKLLMDDYNLNTSQIFLKKILHNHIEEKKLIVFKN